MSVGDRSPGGHLLLLKYGEIGLKGGNRPHFERALVRNVTEALKAVGAARVAGAARAAGVVGEMGSRAEAQAVRGHRPAFRVGTLRGRLIVSLPPGTSEVEDSRLAGAAARVFGVVGVARARKVPLEMGSLTEAVIDTAREAADAGAKTFKLEVRRPNKAFPLPSPEVASSAGRSVLDSVPGLGVDVHEPDVRIGVEIRDDAVYVYGREIPGPGGLPVGTSGRAVALVSGGIDSPVAIWMAMKRGLAVLPLHFWSFPFTGERARQKVIDICGVLGGWGLRAGLVVCPFTEIQTAVRDRCPESLRVTIMRRMMMRVATQLARAEGALAIVTGESLGQVASQTVESLAAIEAVTDLPVLRPLIGLDKEEIITRARAIGTFDLSTLPYEDCCTLFVPARPRIKPAIAEAEAAEAALDVEALVARAVAGSAPAGREER